MIKNLKILHLEDVSTDAIFINRQLKKSKPDCEILVVDTKDKFIAALSNFSPDIILADHTLPSFNSHEALIILNKTGVKIPFIVVTATMSDEFAADMIIKGADDYILKDRLHRLQAAINNALVKHSLLNEKELIVAKLIKSESHLKQTQAIANIGSWELDYASGVAIWSDEQLNIYGLKPASNRQSFETWVAYNHPEDVDVILQKINDVKSTAGNADFFHRIVRLNGTVRYLYSQLRVRVDGAGNQIGLHGVTQDVTEARKRENALQQSQLNLQAIFENTSDGFILADINGIIKAFNTKAKDRIRLNIEQEITVGESIYSFLPHSRKIIYKDNIAKVLTGQILQYDYAYTRKNGETKWFSFTINPVYNAETIEGFSITSTDITKRKKEEQQLKLLESVITNTNDAILITEAEPFDKPGPKIIYVNEAFTRMTGYTADEVIGKTPRILQGPKSDKNELARLSKALRNWQSCEITTVNYKKNGEEFWINFSVSPVADENGWFTHWISIERDVTQRKIDEQERNSLQATLQSSLNEIYIFDFDTLKFSYVNKGALLNLGYSENEIKVLTPLDLKPSFTATSFKQLVAPLKDNEKEKIIFFTNHKRKDGSLYPVEVHLQLVTEGNNKRFLGIVLDITERKIAEDEIKFIANLLNTIGQAAVATEMNGIVNYWNKAAEEIYGWTREEAMGKNIVDLTPSQVTKEQATQIMEMLKKGHQWSGEFRVQRKDGTDFPAWVTDAPIYDEHQNLTGIIGISSDISAQKKLQDLLDKTNKLARLGNYELNVEEGTLYWSEVTREIHEVDEGYVPDIANVMSIYKEGSSRDRITQAVKELTEKNIPYDLEVQIVTAKGNNRWVRIIGQAEFSEGKCIKRYGSFQDIDARKKAEIEVLKVYEEKNIILESIGDGFFAVDKNWVVTYWNNQAAIMMNTPKNKIIDQHLWKVFERSIDSASYKKYHEAIETKRVIRFEDYHLLTGNWFDISAYPSDNGLSVFFKDITEQKKSEDERGKITADLIQRNKDLEQFSYIVSHNMRAPVANIIGLCYVLQKDNLTDVFKSKIVNGLFTSVTMLDNVFNDLNNILKVRQAVSEIKQQVCFSKLVNNISLSIESIVYTEKAVISVDFSAVDEMFTIKTYLHSIFYNLISNSLKYRQPDISPVIKISSQRLDGKIVLIFNDNGMGIDLKKNGHQVFGLYKRFHTDMAEGKGMGLYMVKTEVEALGGKINITSEVNKGTEFKIEF